MILPVLIWWALSAVVGLAAFPLAFRVFSRLPDRGYGLSRALGLLLGGYVLWLGGSVGVLSNDLPGAWSAVAAVASAGALAARGRAGDLRRWLRESRRLVLGMEALFAVAFVLWAFVRANNPDIIATEKPMELAFLNAILRADGFPPPDPWLAGYAISYYYFGYVMLAWLTRLSAVPAGVAFNLGNALWFALTCLGSYSLLYNLLGVGRRASLSGALLGPVFVVLTGNLEGFLEVLHARHLFWRRLADGTWVSGFWSWLNLKDLANPPAAEATWLPQRFLWWWRASRVVRDINLAGADVEVIDEFPFFSFLLADNHPHLLALPFVLLAVGLALQVFLRPTPGNPGYAWRVFRLPDGTWAQVVTVVFLVPVLVLLAAGARQAALGVGWQAAVASALRAGLLGLAGGLLTLLLVALLSGRLESALAPGEFVLAGWSFGALAFLNTWDFPIYLSLLAAVLAWQVRRSGWRAGGRVVGLTAVGLLGLGLLFYLPWYPTFSSQAGGVLPNLLFPTRWPHFFIMFGTSFLPAALWLGLSVARGRREGEGRLLVGLGLGLPLALFALSWIALIIAGAVLLSLGVQPGATEAVLAGLGATELGVRGALGEALLRRLTTPWTALTLGLMVAAVVVLLRRLDREEATDPVQPFLLFLLVIGALLVLGPEFLYLRDLFGTRMNTVFKFYYAAWVLWGLVAAYLVQAPWPGWRGWRLLALAPLALGMVYPVLATYTKAEGFRPAAGRTLDGTAHLARSNPAEYAAIQWLNRNVASGVLAEAVGGSYTQFARVSTHTGIPTVLGWEFHEIQWRGSAEPLGSRAADMQQLYRSRDPLEIEAILAKYGVTYVYVGPLERAAYGVTDLRTFRRVLDLVFENDEVAIFAVPEARWDP